MAKKRKPKRRSGHMLVWYRNRTTPLVVRKGQSTRSKKKPSWGPEVRRRSANQSEEKTIRRGGWVTTRRSKRAKNQRSKIRPALARKQKKSKRSR